MESARRAAALTFDNRTKWKMSCQHQWTRLFSCVRSYTLSATRYHLSLRPRRRSRRPSPFPRACSPGTHTYGGAGGLRVCSALSPTMKAFVSRASCPASSPGLRRPGGWTCACRRTPRAGSGWVVLMGCWPWILLRHTPSS